MNNAAAILRSLVIFAVIVPLAFFVGYLLTNPLDYSSFSIFGVLALILISPILLRWHHPLLILSWNSGVTLFFLPGRPDVWLAMAGISLCILLVQRALGGGIKHIISVPQVTWSLVFLVGVVLVTARLTGMGLRSMGSDVYGGRRYIYLLGAILGFFALSGHRIPPERVGLYVGLFFLSGLVAIIGDFSPIMPSGLNFIYWFFPVNPYYYWMSATGNQGTRLSGATTGSLAVFSYMLAKYGIRGIFLSGKPWRWVVFFLTLIYSLSGGFRGYVMLFALIFALQFYLEGLHRTKLLPIFAFIGILLAVSLVPLTPHLPYSFQRALSFLPLKIDRTVQQDAAGSLDWRLEMWKALLPEIPKHLLLGKGYVLSKMDFDLLTGSDAAIRVGSDFSENQFMALAGGYHSGPLSVILTFGLGGGITFGWFLAAGVWVLGRNYRYGDPALRTVNTFLLVTFGAHIIFFILIFGDISSDMAYFCGWLGLSIALNGGVCQPAPQMVQVKQALDLVKPFPRPRPVFQR
jgi:hypothetical protein